MNTMKNYANNANNNINAGMNTMKNYANVINKEAEFFKSLKVLIDRKDLMTSKETYTILTVSISTNAKGQIKGSTSLMKADENAFLRKVTPIAATIETTSNGVQSFESKDGFTLEYIKVTADRELIKKTKENGIFIDQNTGKVFMELYESFDDKGRQEYINLTTGRIVINIPKTCNRYSMFMYTTSGAKEESILMYNKAIGKSNFEMINEAAPGIWDNTLSLHRHTGYKIPQSLITKVLSRPGLIWTGNVALNDRDKLFSIAEFDGLFDEKDNCFDGAVIGDASKFISVFGVKTEDQVMEIIAQARFLGIIKFQIIFVPHILFEEILKECGSRGNVRVHGQEAPSVIVDKNAVKANLNLQGNGMPMSLMSIGKITKGHYSKQLMEKMLVAASEKGCLDEVKKELIGSFSNSMAEQAVAMQESKEVGLNQDYVLDVLGCVDPSNPIVVNNKYNDMVRTYAKTIDKLSFSADCYNMVVAADIASIFGLRIVKEGEALMGKFSKLNNNSRCYDRAVCVKYPSMGINEVGSVIVLPVHKACDRVMSLYEKGEIKGNVAKGLTKYYKNMSDATIMFSANRKFFDTLAGMDTDFDKITVFFEKIVVDLLFGRDEFIDISVNDEEKEALSTTINAFSKAYSSKRKPADKCFNLLDENLYLDVYYAISEFEGNVGIITFYNNKIVAMLTRAIQGDLAPAKHFLKEVVGFTKAENRKYNSDDSVINPKFVRDIIVEMSSTKWDSNNIISFLKDCIKVFRLYQESTLDAAKTGIYLAILLTVKSISAASLLDVYADENGIIKRKEYEEREIEIRGNDGKVIRKMNTMYLVDDIAEIQNDLMESINVSFAEIYEDQKENFSYSDEDITRFSNAITKAQSTKAGTKYIDSMYLFKKIYQDETSKYLEIIMSDAEGEVKDAAKMSYQKACSGVSNSILRILSKFKASDNFKANLLMGCAIMSQDTTKINRESKSRMAYNLLPGYTFSALIGDNAYTAKGKVLQNGELAKGIELDYHRGVAELNGEYVILADKYNGKAIIEETSDEDGHVHYAAIAYKTIEKEELNDDTFSLVIDKADIDISRNTLVFFEKGRCYIQADATDANSEIVEVKNRFFDGSVEDEFYIEKATANNIYINIAEEGMNPRNVKKDVLVITLVCA